MNTRLLMTVMFGLIVPVANSLAEGDPTAARVAPKIASAEAVLSSHVFRTIFDQGVKVHATDGVVTLSGTVPNHQFKTLAGETAAATPGVQRVENRLEVAPRLTADEQIRVDVIHRLLLARGMGEAAVCVHVDNGAVTLTGEAALVEKSLAEVYAKDAPGVKVVRNEIAVREKGQEYAMDDASQRALVLYALKSYVSTRELKLDVASRDGVVTLRGEIPKHYRDFVQLVAETVRGVDGVKADLATSTG